MWSLIWYTLISNKRIVSFLPSATEILYEIGAGSQIVGVTHECNYPKEKKIKQIKFLIFNFF